jgi:hypothetical protein
MSSLAVFSSDKMPKTSTNCDSTGRRQNALWGRGGRGLMAGLLGVSMVAGLALSSAIHVPEAHSQALACVPLVTTVCPTVPTVTAPGTSVSVPSLPTTGTSTTPTSTTTSSVATTSTTTINADDSNAGQQATATTFAYSLRTVVRKQGARRLIDLRVSLSEPASVVTTLGRRGQAAATSRFQGRQGSNRFRLLVPQRVRAGRYLLTVLLQTEAQRRSITRSLVLPR